MKLEYAKKIVEEQKSLTEMIRARVKKIQDIEGLFDSVEVFVFAKDKNNRIMYCNKYACKLLGIEHNAEVAFRELSELCHDVYLVEKYGKNDKDVLAGKPKLNIIEPLFTDPSRIFRTDKFPITDGDEIIGVLGISVEIKDGRQAN